MILVVDVVVEAGLQAVIVIVVLLASKEVVVVRVVEVEVEVVVVVEEHFHGVKDQVLEKVARKRHRG